MARQKPNNVTDSVFHYLSQKINSGHWRCGDQLPSEAQLCARLGASRVSVRSALSQLAALGLVERQQGRGTFVCSPCRWDSFLHIQDVNPMSIFEFRKIIESESAALAAIRATASDVDALQQTIVKMEENLSDAQVAEQDMLFHFFIAKASNNEVILQIFQNMRETYANMFQDNVAQMGNIGVNQHRKILLDIQVRDMDAARQDMLVHLDNTLRFIFCPSSFQPLV